MCVVSELPGGVAQVVADFKDDLESAVVFCDALIDALGGLAGEIGLTARAPGVPLRGEGSLMERGPVVWAVLVPDPPFRHDTPDSGVSPVLWGEVVGALVAEPPLVSVGGSLNGVPIPLEEVAAHAVGRANEDPAGSIELICEAEGRGSLLELAAGFFISWCVEVGDSRAAVYSEVLGCLEPFLPRLAGVYVREARVMQPITSGDRGDNKNCAGTHWTRATRWCESALFDVWHLNVVPLPLLDDSGFRSAVERLGSDAELDGRLLTVGTPEDWAHGQRESSQVVARARAALLPWVAHRE
jgi:hypothetical protein